MLWATVAALVVEVGGATGAKPGAAISTPPTFALTTWKAAGDNVAAAQGTITLNGAPVSGARVRVDAFDLRTTTDAGGHFVYFVDDTRLARHVVTVVDTSAARVARRRLTKDERSALAAARSAITVGYAVHDLRVSRDPHGRPVVSGRISYAAGAAAPAVSLYSYELTGTVTDANGCSEQTLTLVTILPLAYITASPACRRPFGSSAASGRCSASFSF